MIRTAHAVLSMRPSAFEGIDTWEETANENFPKHTGGAIMLDTIGFYDEVMENKPEEILEFSDWMGIPIEAYRVTLDRLTSLLLDEISL